jgi:acid phosphatase type 7
MTLSNPATEQGTWLQSDLAADKAARPLSGKPCTLAFWHAARFSDISLRKPATSSFWNQLYPYHADVIVNAHSHVYERWTNLSNSSGKATTTNGIPAGITEFVSGTGGNVLAQSGRPTTPTPTSGRTPSGARSS